MYRGILARTSCVLRPYHMLATRKRSMDTNLDVDLGALHPRERGDGHTEEAVYRNRTSVTLQLKARQRERHLRAAAVQQRAMQHYKLDTQHETQLRLGTRLPREAKEMAAVRAMDAADVLAPDAPLRVATTTSSSFSAAARSPHTSSTAHKGEDSGASHSRGGRASSAYAAKARARRRASHDTTLHHQLLRRAVERREHVLDKFGQPPTASEFGKLLQRLRSVEGDDEVIEQHQRRLAEEHGVLAEARLDAYMLDDDSYFPAWVHALPVRVRDRVKYGALGLTEEDEVLRVRLGRLPRDRRLHEWQRLKAAKLYKVAHDEMRLSASELRDARAGRRRFFWLQHRRQRRAALLRRLALRHPEPFAVWPSNAVDYCQRVAFIAQHVENGVQTRGQWPLDSAVLQRAKAQSSRAAAERAFLQTTAQATPTGDGGALTTATSSRMSGAIRDILSSLEQQQQQQQSRPLKYVSRKVYANRVNAIVHGDQDAHGHKHRHILTAAAHRTEAHKSLAEMAAEQELRHEPRVDVSGRLVDNDAEQWPRHSRKYIDGMPSVRAAS